MLELIRSNPKIVIGIVTPLLLAIGYFFRTRWESKKNRKLALYSLMEIWHRVSVFYKSDFDDVFDKLVDELRKYYPQEEMSNESTEAAKAVLTPILLRATRQTAFSDLDGYIDSYQEAISLIASDDPIPAYRISCASNTRKILEFLDNYLGQVLTGLKEPTARSPLFDVLRDSMTEQMQVNSLKDLESDIKRLSIRVSLHTYLATIRVIRKRKRWVERVDDALVSEMVTNVLLPVLSKLNKTATDGS